MQLTNRLRKPFGMVMIRAKVPSFAIASTVHERCQAVSKDLGLTSSYDPVGPNFSVTMRGRQEQVLAMARWADQSLGTSIVDECAGSLAVTVNATVPFEKVAEAIKQASSGERGVKVSYRILQSEDVDPTEPLLRPAGVNLTLRGHPNKTLNFARWVDGTYGTTLVQQGAKEFGLSVPGLN